MTQAAEAKLDSIENVPAALALRQRPAVPGVRSTFGTMTELLNSLRVVYRAPAADTTGSPQETVEASAGALAPLLIKSCNLLQHKQFVDFAVLYRSVK